MLLYCRVLVAIFSCGKALNCPYCRIAVDRLQYSLYALSVYHSNHVCLPIILVWFTQVLVGCFQCWCIELFSPHNNINYTTESRLLFYPFLTAFLFIYLLTRFSVKIKKYILSLTTFPLGIFKRTKYTQYPTLICWYKSPLILVMNN